MYDKTTIKKALGKKRCSKIEDFDVYGNGECDTIDITFKYPWHHDGHGTTTYIYDSWGDNWSQKAVIDDLKFHIDCLSDNEKTCPINPDGTWRQNEASS